MTTGSISTSRSPACRGFSLRSALLSGRAPTLAIAPRMSPAEQTPVCKHFKLHLPLAIEWVDARLKLNGKRATYRE